MTRTERQLFNRLREAKYPPDLRTARQMIRVAAGAPQRTRVYLANYEASAPRLQKRDGEWDAWHQKFVVDRRVIVGIEWIREHLPNIFAQMCAARLLNGRLPIPRLTEDSW